MDCMVEHIAFDHPDDMQRFVHIFSFNCVAASHWSTTGIGLGYSKPYVPLDEHLWITVAFFGIHWIERRDLQKRTLIMGMMCFDVNSMYLHSTQFVIIFY